MLHNDKATDDGMILDFGDVKTLAAKHLVELWDHAFLVYRGDTKVVEFLEGMEGGHKTVVLDDVPTVENLAQIAFDILEPVFRNVYGHHLRLSSWCCTETPIAGRM